MWTGGKSALTKESLTGRCYIYAVGPNRTLTSSTTLDKPWLSLENMTGFIVFLRRGTVPDSLAIGNRGLSPKFAVCI